MSLANAVSDVTTQALPFVPLCDGYACLYSNIDVGKDLCHACYRGIR